MRGSREDREHGAGERIRTADLRITNALLYQLSYTGEGSSLGTEPKRAEHDMQIRCGQQGSDLSRSERMAAQQPRRWPSASAAGCIQGVGRSRQDGLAIQQ